MWVVFAVVLLMVVVILGVLVLVVVIVIGVVKGVMLVVGNGGVRWWMWHVVCVGCGCWWWSGVKVECAPAA